MRSRYTAYCQGNVDYLLATLHPSQRKFDDRINLRQSVSKTHWVTLQILAVAQGQPTDAIGFVEFVAVYQTPDLGQLHERSKFVQVEGHWFYQRGTILPPYRPKRNEPCWCGSGKKFKQCHG
jgi:SEC-C motif-containing protein